MKRFTVTIVTVTGNWFTLHYATLAEAEAFIETTVFGGSFTIEEN